MLSFKPLLSYKKECMWISSNDMDEPTAYYAEWSKSEKENKYIKTYTWTLERWYWGTYVQDGKGDADTENRLMDTEGEGKGGINWQSSTETYITICKIDRQWEFAVWLRELKSSALWQPREMGWSGR